MQQSLNLKRWVPLTHDTVHFNKDKNNLNWKGEEEGHSSAQNSFFPGEEVYDGATHLGGACETWVSCPVAWRS